MNWAGLRWWWACRLDLSLKPNKYKPVLYIHYGVDSKEIMLNNAHKRRSEQKPILCGVFTELLLTNIQCHKNSIKGKTNHLINIKKCNNKRKR